MNRIVVLFLCLLQFFIPLCVYGDTIFTEIMYDPKGADDGHEWVEIRNSGSSPVDLSGWKFSEGGTNHGLTVVSGETTLVGGAYAIIADDAVKFMSDFPQFSDTIFDSSFSLSNTGELIVLKSKNLEAVDSFTYSSSIGASGDGNSLQKNTSGAWSASLSTPGAGPQVISGETQFAQASSSESSVSVPPSGGSISSWPVEPQVFANAGKDRIVIVGASVLFEGKALGLKKEPLDNARYVWNFGDGGTGERKIAEHTYRHPGDYLVVMEVVSGYFSGQDQVKVHAEISPLFISAITDGSVYFIEINNPSNSDLDISSWWLALDGKTFEIPKNTFVMGGKKLVFANEVTGLAVVAGSVPELRYPNGTLANRFGETKPIIRTVIPEGIAISKVAVSDVPVPKNKTPVTYTETGQDEEENMATPALAAKDAGLNYVWLLGVLGISVVALVGIFFTRRLERPEDRLEKIAQEIEIIEG